MPEGLQRQFEFKSDHIALASAPKQSFVAARTARKDKPEALQGFHAEHLLFVLDEASGIDEIIFQVAEGALSTPGAKVFMTSNPTRTSGYFFDSHHRMRSHWATQRVSCIDSPRVSRQYVEEMGEKYGRDSNVYRVRVLGEFPTQDDDVVIPLELLEAATHRDIDKEQEADEIWGVDVARFGEDSSALAKRKGHSLKEPVKEWKGRDTMQTAGIIANEYEATHRRERPKEIIIDVVGIGAGVVDRLNEMGLPVRGVNVGESPSARAQYVHLRDELWFRGREWFESRAVSFAGDDATVAELSTARYAYASTGKIKVESKEEMKKRGIKSPDRADAFLLTLAAFPQAQQRMRPLQYSTRGIV